MLIVIDTSIYLSLLYFSENECQKINISRKFLSLSLSRKNRSIACDCETTNRLNSKIEDVSKNQRIRGLYGRGRMEGDRCVIAPPANRNELWPRISTGVLLLLLLRTVADRPLPSDTFRFLSNECRAALS